MLIIFCYSRQSPHRGFLIPTPPVFFCLTLWCEKNFNSGSHSFQWFSISVYETIHTFGQGYSIRVHAYVLECSLHIKYVCWYMFWRNGYCLKSAFLFIFAHFFTVLTVPTYPFPCSFYVLTNLWYTGYYSLPTYKLCSSLHKNQFTYGVSMSVSSIFWYLSEYLCGIFVNGNWVKIIHNNKNSRKSPRMTSTVQQSRTRTQKVTCQRELFM